MFSLSFWIKKNRDCIPLGIGQSNVLFSQVLNRGRPAVTAKMARSPFFSNSKHCLSSASPEPTSYSGKLSGLKHDNWIQANRPFPSYTLALQFFLIGSWIICLSKLRFAINFFSCIFSSSNGRNFLSSVTLQARRTSYGQPSQFQEKKSCLWYTHLPTDVFNTPSCLWLSEFICDGRSYPAELRFSQSNKLRFWSVFAKYFCHSISP